MIESIESVIVPQTVSLVNDDFRRANKYKPAVSVVPTVTPKTYDEQIVVYESGATSGIYVYIDDAWVFLDAGASSYTDRGDLSSYDLTATVDGAWTEWDASSIIGTNCKLVKVKMQMRSSSADSYAQIRTDGNSNDVASTLFAPAVANSYMYNIADIKPSSAGKLEYKISTDFNTANFVILGYWS